MCRPVLCSLLTSSEVKICWLQPAYTLEYTFTSKQKELSSIVKGFNRIYEWRRLSENTIEMGMHTENFWQYEVDM